MGLNDLLPGANNSKPKKKPKKVTVNTKEKETNYLRFLVDPTIESEFRYLVSIRQGEEVRKGNKKPTIGDIFEEMIENFKKR